MYAKGLQKLANRTSSAMLQGSCHHCNLLLIVWSIKDVVVISLDGKTLLGARFIRRYFLRVQQRNERLYHPTRGTGSSVTKPYTINSQNKHTLPRLFIYSWLFFIGADQRFKEYIAIQSFTFRWDRFFVFWILGLYRSRYGPVKLSPG